MLVRLHTPRPLRQLEGPASLSAGYHHCRPGRCLSAWNASGRLTAALRNQDPAPQPGAQGPLAFSLPVLINIHLVLWPHSSPLSQPCEPLSTELHPLSIPLLSLNSSSPFKIQLSLVTQPSSAALLRIIRAPLTEH